RKIYGLVWAVLFRGYGATRQQRTLTKPTQGTTWKPSEGMRELVTAQLKKRKRS
ncbi:hypothetical protein L916_03431, partial [Phytophthora nicotianae]